MSDEFMRRSVREHEIGKSPVEEDPLAVLREAHDPFSAERLGPGQEDGRHLEEVADRESGRESADPPREERGKLLGSPRVWILFGLLLLALAVGYRHRDLLREKLSEGRKADGMPAARDSAKAVYYCPMHPEYTSDRPGQCPICGMTLVKKEEAHAGAPAPESADRFPPGTVHISPTRQQLIGVTYGEVGFGPITHTIRTVGRITYDETKIVRIHPKVEGWIEKVHVDYVGKLVRAGQPLLELYSPELVATQQEYLLALRAVESFGRSAYPEIAERARSLYEASRRRLELWDISEDEIRRVRQRGEPLRTLTLYAPATGVVLTRNAFERQRVTPETELYTIADLSTVWVLADIYEYEASMIRVGQAATMTLPYDPGRVFRGRVVYVYPNVESTTRTVKVRMEFPNPGLRLKPEMYANVEIHISYGQHLWVPEEAILDSGEEQIVFVAHEGGYFEPRRVQLGPRVGNRYVILSGLARGEKIVTSGNFLIDSESRLRLALQGMGGHQHVEAPGRPAREDRGRAPEEHRHD